VFFVVAGCGCSRCTPLWTLTRPWPACSRPWSAAAGRSSWQQTWQVTASTLWQRHPMREAVQLPQRARSWLVPALCLSAATPALPCAG
jgi:hypothetical protein